MRKVIVLLGLVAACGGGGAVDAGADLGAETDAGGDAGSDSGGDDAGSDAGLVYPACDPRAPSACPTDERCALSFEFSRRGVGSFSCRRDPGGAEGAACAFQNYTVDVRRGLSRDDCGGGLACADVLAVGGGLACARVCETGADCRAGEVCEVLLVAAISAAPLTHAGVCRMPVACDPVGGSGCAASTACAPLVTTDGALATACRVVGGLEEDRGCIAHECVAGAVCAAPPRAAGVELGSDDTRCRRACDPASPGACGAGATCVARAGDALGLCAPDEEAPLGGARPVRVVVPASYDGTTAVPLLLALHGNPGDSTRVDETFGISVAARANGFIALLADGTRDTVGTRFWNATPACCDFDTLGVDDSTYLRSVLDEATARYRVDPARVWVFGTSNGGFMAHRLACDHGDVVTAIASRAGSTFELAADCAAPQPVSVLELHGDHDANVPYAGGAFPGGTYPGAVETVERWAMRDGCDVAAPIAGLPFDLDLSIAGDETLPTAYGACTSTTAAELWTLRGSTHFYTYAPDFTPRVLAWLAAHPR